MNKRVIKNLSLLLMLIVTVPQAVLSQKINLKTEPKALVDHYRFVGDHREESMWSALYGAKSGKIYMNSTPKPKPCATLLT